MSQLANICFHTVSATYLLKKERCTDILSVTVHCELSRVSGCLPEDTRLGTIYGIFPVVRYVNVIAFTEQNVEPELHTQNREGGPRAGAAGPFTSEAVAGYFFPSSVTPLRLFFKNGYNTFYHKGILKWNRSWVE